MDDGDTTIIVGAIVAVLALISVILRFWVRYSRSTGFGWDDWLILFSILTIIAIDATDLYAVNFDPGGAEAASSDGEIEYTPADVIFTKITFAGTVLYFTVTSTTKLSILFLYNRLFAVDKYFRRQVTAVMVAVTGFGISTIVADLLNCIPLKWTWLNSLDDPRYCFNYNHFWLATGIVEGVIDVVILILPIPVLSQLRLGKGKKLAVVGVFLVGIFVVASGIVKTTLSFAPNSREPSFAPTQLWSTVHLCTGIVCACLPVCWPLIVTLRRLNACKWLLGRHTPSPRHSNKTWHGASGWSSRERRILHLERGHDASPAHELLDSTETKGRTTPQGLPPVMYRDCGDMA